MTARKILTVGFALASDNTQHVSFISKMSLLDWDIVLFKPDISDFTNHSGGYYQGKPSLSDSASFQLKECCEHWRREIKQAVDNGKTVIVFLTALCEIYIDTGQRTHSGTGRNQKTTRQVALYNNYHAIPASLSPVSTTGSSMKLSTRGSENVAAFWAEFESNSRYHVLLTEPNVPACILTRTGDKSVGAQYRSKSSPGTLLLLPDIDFYPANFINEEEDEQTWTEEASQFAARMVSASVALDKALRSSADVTPEPVWATSSSYSLGTENKLRLELLEAEQQLELAQKRKEAIPEELLTAGKLRALLFEKGKPLENAIIQALQLLGFTAAQFKSFISEFDVVFESKEGRLIGEAEGKDAKAINIDKLRQLSMNIQEDLQRDEIPRAAKPVLFGNAYRFQPLNQRPDPFTEKCLNAAASSLTALVFTPDLFLPVQYLIGHVDEDYACSCRVTLLASTGRVVFPSPPAIQSSREEDQTEAVK